MRVHCNSFGSLWWLRPGNEIDDPQRFVAKAAVFNTTGFVAGSQMRRLWHVAGVVRINAGMHPEARTITGFLARTFETEGLEHRGGWNRLLLGCECTGRGRPPDAVLLSVSSERVGRIDFGTQWHSDGVKVVAASARRGIQETLLLAKTGSTISTERAKWEVTWDTLQFRR